MGVLQVCHTIVESWAIVNVWALLVVLQGMYLFNC